MALGFPEERPVRCLHSYSSSQRWFALSILLLHGIAAFAAADDRNPLANNPNAAKAGEYEFRINCALCHGLGAHGGGRGPDLTRAQ